MQRRRPGALRVAAAHLPPNDTIASMVSQCMGMRMGMRMKRVKSLAAKGLAIARSIFSVEVGKGKIQIFRLSRALLCTEAAHIVR